MSYPAFKEWRVIVEALGAGEQILILRKGGIAEGRGGFQVQARRFWLFPTEFHAQLGKTKPAAARWFSTNPDSADTPPQTVQLRCFADVERSVFLDEWAAVARLDAHHSWSEATIHERFHAQTPAGLHALVLRVYRLCEPIVLPLTPAMGGCKSWVELPCPFAAHDAQPVLTQEAFGSRVSALAL